MLFIYSSGTGKTVTLVECALQLLSTRLNADGYFSDSPSHGASPRLLLCAPQNYSADLICSALAEAGLTPQVMTRLQDPRRRPAEVGGVNDRAHSILHYPFGIVTVVFSLDTDRPVRKPPAPWYISAINHFFTGRY